MSVVSHYATDNKRVVLLCDGGNKRTQGTDIARSTYSSSAEAGLARASVAGIRSRGRSFA